jgi:methionyl-tRNA formyltransferase
VSGGGSDGLIVAGGVGWLRILELQPEGKKRMKADDYVRGYPLTEGEVLG